MLVTDDPDDQDIWVYDPGSHLCCACRPRVPGCRPRQARRACARRPASRRRTDRALFAGTHAAAGTIVEDPNWQGHDTDSVGQFFKALQTMLEQREARK